MARYNVPEFAMVGHPNEGKSSVVSTLTEDDSVKISETPGETLECREFPVTIDGEQIIRFVDTPGFQNPKLTLNWINAYSGSDDELMRTFLESHRDNPDFKHECELFTPISKGAGIIYVLDASHPLRNHDKAEMEILRLTGRPRMAILNCKDEDTRFLNAWKSELRKHFNSVRVFNAHKATYAERIELLESLKSIDQDWQPAIEEVITVFKKDWERRNAECAEIICELLAQCLGLSVTKNYTEKTPEESVRREVQADYSQQVQNMEAHAHQLVRRLYKHNIFKYDLPPQSILYEDLFNEKTWQVLGLRPSQLAAAAGFAGGAIGAALDVAAAGLTFGIFTAIGGMVGAGSAMFGGKRFVKTKVIGMALGGYQIKIGPNENIQFLYVLLDRALIYYSHAINWAHGRRDRDDEKTDLSKIGYTSEWDDFKKNICTNFFKTVHSHDDLQMEIKKKDMIEMLQEVLNQISHSERKYGLMFKD